MGEESITSVTQESCGLDLECEKWKEPRQIGFIGFAFCSLVKEKHPREKEGIIEGMCEIR